MKSISLFLALTTFAEAAIAPPHLPSRVNHAPNALHKRSPGLYAAILRGDGTTAEGWPSIDQWVDSVETMFERNRQTISASCSQWGLSNNSEDETNSIKKSILKVERSSGIDARFILSIVLQESQGCVRVQTTDNGVVNSGLMQSHDGSGSCNKNGIIQDPCPESEILQMIIDGVEGTSTGPGLRTLVAQEGGTADATSFYKAARVYNSGAVASSGDLDDGRATHCYVSDIVSRLVNWTDGPSLCALGNTNKMPAGYWEGKTNAESGHGAISTTTARPLTQGQDDSFFSAGLLYPSFTQSSVKRPSASLSFNQNPLFCKRKRSSLAI